MPRNLLGLDICFSHLGIIRSCQEHVQPFTGKYDWDWTGLLILPSARPGQLPVAASQVWFPLSKYRYDPGHEEMNVK